MSESTPEWLTPDEGEEVTWVGEPELASKAGELVVGIALLPLLGLGLPVILPAYLQVKHTDYVVTNQSLYAKSGILSTNIQSLELDKIQNTEYSQSFVEKQLGYGTVGVDTAGGTGIELEFEAIAGAREVQESVRELSKQYRAPSAGADGAESGGTGRGISRLPPTNWNGPGRHSRTSRRPSRRSWPPREVTGPRASATVGTRAGRRTRETTVETALRGSNSTSGSRRRSGLI